MNHASSFFALLLLGAGVPLGLHRSSAPAAPSSGSTAAAETYDVDGGHSMVVFRVLHLGVSNNYGRFNQIGGSFVWDAAKPEASSIQLTVQAESVDTGIQDRDNHLRGPDFFDAKQFPTITFQSTKVEKQGDRSLKVSGDLTLHGVKKAVTVEVTHVGTGKDPWGGYRTGFETRFSIKRSDFGMNKLLEGVGDEVTLMVNVEGVRK